MGNDCLASTPVDHYKSYFENVKTSEIKDFWTTIQVYKIKKLYDAVAAKHPDYQKHTHLQLQQFISLFPELQNYPERQKLRIFEIFNFDGNGLVDWNNFYTMISICYFGSEEILAVMMFLIFDEGLAKQLTKDEVESMCLYNQFYIISKQQSGKHKPLFDSSEIANKLLDGSINLKIEKWLQEYKKYFNINKFRRIFNIFIQEKLEKDLIKHFSQYNNLFVPDEDRYVSYVIDFKWFETWKLYVKQEYGYCLSSSNKKPITFKTKKLLKVVSSSNGQKKVADPLTLRELKFEEKKNIKKVINEDNDDVPEEVKNFDFIHSNIGQKPKQIYNKVLEGDFEQILRQDIIENRDYVLISQKVWKTLKRIYEGYPQFRRTGFDYIELYPKILRILPVKKGIIMYNQENIKQVSAYYAIEDIIEAIINKDELQSKKFYFKCFGMNKWQQIKDLSSALAQLTTQIIIYIASVHKIESEIFQKKYGKIPKDISQINVGDEVIFHNQRRGRDMNMIFLGKNIEGKCILHAPGESYIQDICIMENELVKKGKYNPLQEIKLSEMAKISKKEDSGLIGIPNNKGLGYINSVIMHLYYNSGLRQQLLLSNYSENDLNNCRIVATMSMIFKDINSKNKIKTKIISEAIEEVLPDFNQFSAEMCNQFFNQFYETFSKQLTEQKLKDYPQNNKLAVEKTVFCKNCKKTTTSTEERYTLVLPLHNNPLKYYEIIFVPFCQNLNGAEMKRYAFKLRSGATLNEYKNAFEAVAGLKQENKTYLLMEVYADNVVKNYSTAKNDATLDELLLRDTDTIIAYELKVNFQDFIYKHYSQNVDFENDEVKIDQFIDCKNTTRGWIFGKVCQKDFTPYGHRTIIRVIHKFSKGQQWQISYDVDEESVANFPTRSYLNGEQYHLRLQQRYFNEASNDMELCNMPLVIVLTNWMRWRQFYYLVYLQIRKFINEDFFKSQLSEQQEQQDEFHIYSNKSLGSKSKRKTQKKVKLNNFKQFLYGPDFPYKLNFVDYSGRCAMCFKFLKGQIFQGQQDSYCSGCELSASEPISWQIKIADVMVCVDWKKLNFIKKQVVKDHSSFANLATQKKNDIQTLSDCFQALDVGYSQNTNQICCNIQTEVIVKQKIKSLPQNLTIFLERIIEQNDLIKIINKHVKFEQEIKINNESYTLFGVTSLQGGSNKSTKYRVFVTISNEQWLEYDGNVVRTVKRNYVEKLCALNLYYRKKEDNHSNKINS